MRFPVSPLPQDSLSRPAMKDQCSPPAATRAFSGKFQLTPSNSSIPVKKIEFRIGTLTDMPLL